jgi:hypothetical protein
MWICLNDAFFSVVRDKTDPDVLKVRARKKSHLEQHFPHHRILKDDKADYRFRVIASREDVARLMIRTIAALDYVNFKNSVKDRELHDMYALWWGDHHAYQTRDGRRKL